MQLYKRKFHGKCKGLKHRSQSKGGGNCHNCGTSHPLKCFPVYGKIVIIVIKRDTSSLFVEVISIARLVQDGREIKVNPGRTNMKFHHVIKLMTVAGMHVNRIPSRLCTIKVFMEIYLTFALTI